jgi:hypothetical protein
MLAAVLNRLGRRRGDETEPWDLGPRDYYATRMCSRICLTNCFSSVVIVVELVSHPEWGHSVLKFLWDL